MPKNLLLSFLLAAVAILAKPSAGHAQNAPPAPQTPRPYNPGMGDLMNGIVQPRHAKLGLAGREQNWELAAYALHELKQALQNVALSRPRWREFSVPEMIDAVAKEPIESIDRAIKAGDARQFSEAFARLTDGCNSCHGATNNRFVVIKVPDQSLFANQDFRTPK
jgi:hypothetical protein